MEKASGPSTQQSLLRRYICLAVLGWSAIVVGLSISYLVIQRNNSLEMARISARAAHEKDVIYRRWNAFHGGVYAPVTDENKPNPYLDVPEREVTTPSGRVLTLINPAYMTRQVHELLAKNGGTRAHITSLKPLNPVNAPDDWERQALHAFELGQSEVSDLEERDGQLRMRLIRPLSVEKGCLKCHGAQGYQLGDVRGGISVSVPVDSIWSTQAREAKGVLFGHAALWAVGMAGIGVAGRNISRHVADRERARRTLETTALDLERANEELESEQSALLAARLQLQQKNADLEISLSVANAAKEKLKRANSALHTEIANRKQAEANLKQAQSDVLQSEKLAAVGQLAAGIAHEINTPIQFVGDNVQACSEMFGDLDQMFRKLRVLLEQLEQENLLAERVAEIRRTEEEIDVAYIFDDAPQAFAQSLEGLERVRTIVQAMKDFSHVGKSDERVAFDLNAALQSTLTVARNELKYVADVQTDFADLPYIEGYPGELNQVFLNLLVNAAHAIGDKGSDKRGVISVRTRVEGEWVVVSISDTGCGIPDSVRNKIFEPFFSTKAVGRGSGQGLAISRNIVVDRHQGWLEFESEVGVGTTFHVYIPLQTQTENTDNHHDTSPVC